MWPYGRLVTIVATRDGPESFAESLFLPDSRGHLDFVVRPSGNMLRQAALRSLAEVFPKCNIHVDRRRPRVCSAACTSSRLATWNEQPQSSIGSTTWARFGLSQRVDPRGSRGRLAPDVRPDGEQQPARWRTAPRVDNAAGADYSAVNRHGRKRRHKDRSPVVQILLTNDDGIYAPGLAAMERRTAPHGRSHRRRARHRAERRWAFDHVSQPVGRARKCSTTIDTAAGPSRAALPIA